MKSDVQSIIPALVMFFSSIHLSYSQTPGIQWQKPFGGTDYESFTLLQKTSDQGVLLLIRNYSTDGDFAVFNTNFLVKINKAGYTEWKKALPVTVEFKAGYVTETDELYLFGDNSSTGTHGGSDIWVGKLNSAGNIIWQNSYGGTGGDAFGSFVRNPDGSFVIAGIAGNRTGNITGNYHGQSDVWIFKIDADGIIQWNQCYGGSMNESNGPVKIKASGTDYVVLTETLSGDGDLTGHIGAWDTWTFKINATGVLQWQIHNGGGESETSTDIVEAVGGGYYVLSSSVSSALPNTHSNTIDPDIYVVKLSASGALEWHKCFGGAWGDSPMKIFAEDDGGCVIFSNVNVINGNSGDIIGFSGSYEEIWAIKVDADQNIVWQRTIGGTDVDGLADVIEEKSDDNGNLLPESQRSYVLIGRSLSTNRDIIGYHPNPPVSTQSQYFDLWLGKMKKSDRTLLWSRCIGGKHNENLGAFVKLNSKEYIIGGITESNDGDVTGLHGPPANLQDIWIIKLGPVNTIKGTVYLDMNSNGIKDPTERYYDNAMVKSEKTNDTKISVTTNGIFKSDADTGTYTSNIISALPYYTSSLSAKQSVFTEYYQKDSFAFPLVPIPGHWDLSAFIIPFSEVRPNFAITYRLVVKNAGSETANSPVLNFIKDSRMSFALSSVPPTSNVGNNISWTLPSIAPLETVSIELTLSVPPPPAANQGDMVQSMLSISSAHPEETLPDNSDTLRQVLVDSYDPNDKNETHGGSMAKTAVQAGAYLKYIVRFQNTGTAPAINVRITDTLDSRVDWSTLEIIAYSHSATFNIEGNNRITWSFQNINLPSQASNEPASHGYIAYRVKPLSNLAAADIVTNAASIYFDFNPPIQTNFALTLITDNTVLPLILLDFTGNFNNGKTNLSWSTSNEVDVQNFSIERSFDGAQFTIIGSKDASGNNAVTNYNWTDDLAGVSASSLYYRLKMIDIDGGFSYSKIIRLDVFNVTNNTIKIVPNPVTGQYAQVFITSGINADAWIRITDIQGKILVSQTNSIFAGNNTISLKGLQALQRGVYTVQIKLGEEIKVLKFVKN